jgi:CspA family cold shock protein
MTVMSHRTGRVLGYIAAAGVGIGISVVLVITAASKSLCGTWGEECTPAERAEMARLVELALAAPFVTVLLYGLFDLVVLHSYWDSDGGGDDLRPMGPPVPTAPTGPPRGPVEGVTVMWRDEGWGVLASPDVDGWIWTHAYHLEGTGPRSLAPGQAVTFTYQSPGQDEYPYRSIGVTPR